MKHTLRRWLCAILFTVSAPTATAADAVQPIVRVEATPTEVMVGHPVRLRVIVLVPTWFTQPSTYPSFELANTITRLPPDSSFNTRERVGGETWTGIARDYQINPQVAAVYNLSGLRMRVNYAHPETRQSTPVHVDVPPITFRATVPEAATDLRPFLAGTHGRLERDVEGNLQDLKAGDAIVVTVTARLAGMPAMFLPELIAPTEQQGLTAYPSEPEVEDGEVATRTERVTYVFSGGGTFTLPRAELDWWNPDSAAIERSALEPLVISVTGPVAPATEEHMQAERASWLIIAGWSLRLGAFALAVLLLNKGWRALAGWRATRMAAHRASEPYAFHNLTRALQRGEPGELDSALRTWLDRLDGRPSLATLGAATGVSVYQDMLALNRSRHGPDQSNATPDMAALADRLRRARTSYLDKQRRQGEHSLPPLNPAGNL